MEKPIYLGFCILDLSKSLMYKTYYDKVQQYYGIDNIMLSYKDTNSLLLKVKTNDLVSDLEHLQKQYKRFDFSNLNKVHQLYSNEFKKIPGYLKIKTPKTLYINKFVCLRSKVYVYKRVDDYDNKLKGIKKSRSKDFIFDQYRNCLYDYEYTKEVSQNIIRSINHDNYMQEVTKKSLSSFNYKRKYF